jgi:hypothetical protein
LNIIYNERQRLSIRPVLNIENLFYGKLSVGYEIIPPALSMVTASIIAFLEFFFVRAITDISNINTLNCDQDL